MSQLGALKRLLAAWLQLLLRLRRQYLPNPVRYGIRWIGLALARAGLIDRERAIKTTELAWPRVVTGIARMSKNAVDVAMVGVAVGTTAVAGVGFASPYWGAAFAIGGGVAGGTIALVSQRYGAEAFTELGQAVRASALLVVLLTVPLSTVFWLFPYEFISLLSNSEQAIEHGVTYLKLVGLGIPFAGLNLVGSRTLVGSDDAYTAMQVRAGGALLNIGLNAVLIFSLGWGVAGAALGTVLSNAAATSVFAVGFTLGRFPGVGRFPVQISPVGGYAHPGMVSDIVSIGLPVGLRNLVWVTFQFPMLGILDLFGENTVAAWVIARRVWGLMNTPGWGFGLASSSLVGQALGRNDESKAEAYGYDIIRFAVATYVVFALIVAAFTGEIVVLFADDPTDAAVPIARNLVYAACVGVVFQGVAGAAAGPLDASGDTRIPFLSRFLGMFCVSIPLAYLGAVGLAIPAVGLPVVGITTPAVSIPALGLWGLYLAFVTETTVPAAINYWRFRTDRWKSISEEYRPEATPADD
jgi:putative MATE family efflux protein